MRLRVARGSGHRDHPRVATGSRSRATRSTPSASSGWSTAAGAARARASPSAPRYALGEALGLWQGRALPTWTAGRPRRSRRRGWRSSGSRPRSSASRPRAPGRHRTCSRGAGAGGARRRSASGAGALLALAQYQAGRQGEALGTLHRARTVLASELGLDPGTELVELEQAILRQDPALLAPTSRPGPAPTARTRAWFLTTSATPRPSSAATPRSPSACADSTRCPGGGGALGVRQVVTGPGRRGGVAGGRRAPSRDRPPALIRAC